MASSFFRGAALSRRERLFGYVLTAATAVVYLVIWFPALIGDVHTKSHSFFEQPIVAVVEGLVLMGITAFMILRDRRRIAGAFAILVGIGAGWGTLVLAAFPLLAWGVFVGFKVDPETVAARRAAREQRKTGKNVSTNSSEAPRPLPTPSKRYTPPKSRTKRRGRS